ncbi:MAG: hypothetical protein IKN55_04865 [Oscillospiraceae bacterium]|nr:hypothetical protein [Oscillospiraceae bacterium]
MALFNKRFPGWHLETDEYTVSSFTAHDLRKAVHGVHRCKLGYCILTPPRPVRGCVFVQFCLDDKGKYHIEYSFADENRANVLRCREGISGGELDNLLDDLLEKGWIPDTSRWETAGVFPDRYDRHVYEEILKLIGGIPAVEAFSYALDSPQGWYHEHSAAYEARGIPFFSGIGRLLWVGMTDLLLSGGCLVELEHKAGLAEFLGAVRHIAEDLPVEEAWFREEHSLPRWCAMLDRKWWDTGCCMGAIDIGSDSYVLFITTRVTLGRLRDLAKELGECIDLAKLM